MRLRLIRREYTPHGLVARATLGDGNLCRHRVPLSRGERDGVVSYVGGFDTNKTRPSAGSRSAIAVIVSDQGFQTTAASEFSLAMWILRELPGSSMVMVDLVLT